jgi:hypothetical protein
MMPTVDPGKQWSIDELERAANSPPIQPVSRGWSGFNYVRGSDGYGVYAVTNGDPSSALAVVFVFTSGEVWSIDTYWLRPHSDGKKIVPAYAEGDFRRALVEYGSLLERLEIPAPYKWTAGMEKLKERILYLPTRPGYQRLFQSHDGECMEDDVVETGLYSPGDAPGLSLKPFFAKLYESCGVSRRDWQDA